MRLTLLLATLPSFQHADVDAAIRAFEARRYAEARPALHAAAATDPRAPLYLGRIELVEGDAGAAVKWLEQAAKRAPRSAEAHRWLGRAYARQVRRAGRLKQLSLAARVRESFETAVRLDPASVPARRDLMQYYLLAPRIAGGSRDKARQQARAIAQGSAMHGRIAAAWVKEAAGDRAGAERELAALADQFADSAAPAIALGALQQRAKQWDAALATYRRLLARLPAAREAWYQIGRVASESGHALDEGAAALERFVAMPAGEEDAPLAGGWQRLGIVRERRQDAAGARAAYQRALRLDPGFDDAKAGLRRVAAR